MKTRRKMGTDNRKRYQALKMHQAIEDLNTLNLEKDSIEEIEYRNKREQRRRDLNDFCFAFIRAYEHEDKTCVNINHFQIVNVIVDRNHPSGNIMVHIESGCPGIIIDKGGQGIDKLKKHLKISFDNQMVDVNIIEDKTNVNLSLSQTAQVYYGSYL